MKHRILVVLATFMVICFLLVACEPTPYSGRDNAQYTVAVWSILGGYEDMSSYIKVIETDAYGRTLCQYRVGTRFYEDWLYAYVICQKSDNVYAYYYDGLCFETGAELDGFSDTNITALKARNDWGLPLKDENMVKRMILSGDTKKYLKEFGVEFLRLPIDVSVGSSMMEAYEEIDRLLSQNIDTNTVLKMKNYEKSDQDNYGRGLYFVRTFTQVNSQAQKEYADAYVLIIQPDGTYKTDVFVMKLDNPYDYWQQLMEFKKLNDWNKEPK